MKTGIDVLAEKRFIAVRSRRVGLLSHQAALTRCGATSAQLLHAALGSRLVALFGPEHGFFGQAGAGKHTFTRRHPTWDIPVHALYGERRRPSPAMLKDVDLVICDLQDLGVRCYTYLATLHNMLAACETTGVEVLVTDRPIPLPCVVDGPLTTPEFTGFVAPCRVPLVYGMTPAESALWMQRTCFPKLRLTVMPMSGWTRSDAAWDGSRPPFMPPSPAIRSWECAMTYAATIFCEALPGIDCGRSTNLSFRVLGAPWLRAAEFCEALSQLRLPGLACHPHRYVAADNACAGKELDGIRLTVIDPMRFKPVTTSLALLRLLTQKYGRHHVWHHPGVRSAWFDKLYGTSATRRALLDNTPLHEITRAWQTENRAFLKTRAASLLYATKSCPK